MSFIWEDFSELEKIKVKSFSYVISKDEDRGCSFVHDDFLKTIVRKPNFKNLYILLKEGEEFYLYLLEDFEENPDVFRIESYLEYLNLHNEQKEEVNISGSYADYVVFRLNKYFRDAYKDLIEKRVEKLRIVCNIYRVKEISQLYDEYAVLEADLLLKIKEVF